LYLVGAASVISVSRLVGLVTANLLGT
jgi:hypothetical protein